MQKDNQKKPPLEQPELPNIPPKPKPKEVKKLVTIQRVSDPKGKKVDKIIVNPEGDGHPYHIYILCTKLERTLAALERYQYDVITRTIIETENGYNNL